MKKHWLIAVFLLAFLFWPLQVYASCASLLIRLPADANSGSVEAVLTELTMDNNQEKLETYDLNVENVDKSTTTYTVSIKDGKAVFDDLPEGVYLIDQPQAVDGYEPFDPFLVKVDRVLIAEPKMRKIASHSGSDDHHQQSSGDDSKTNQSGDDSKNGNDNKSDNDNKTGDENKTGTDESNGKTGATTDSTSNSSTNNGSESSGSQTNTQTITNQTNGTASGSTTDQSPVLSGNRTTTQTTTTRTTTSTPESTSRSTRTNTAYKTQTLFWIGMMGIVLLLLALFVSKRSESKN